MSTWTPPEEKPLKLKRCQRTDCDNGLHCYLKHRNKRTPEGTCWACGVGVVDWSRVRQLDIADVRYTASALRTERIRHEFWCTVKIPETVLRHAMWKGRIGLPDAAKRRLRSSVGKPADAYDGRRTPFEDNVDKSTILTFGQHATATCCRKCIAVWHGIPVDRALTDAEVEYFAQLLVAYAVERIPELPEEGVPRKRGVRTAHPRGLRRAS